MQHLGEDAYSLMKTTNNAMRLSHPMMSSTKNRSFGALKGKHHSRPITSTTKPTMAGTGNAQSLIKLSKDSSQRDYSALTSNAHILKRSDTTEHGKRQRIKASKLVNQRRPISNISSSGVYSIAQCQPNGRYTSASRVTFL